MIDTRNRSIVKNKEIKKKVDLELEKLQNLDGKIISDKNSKQFFKYWEYSTGCSFSPGKVIYHLSSWGNYSGQLIFLEILIMIGISILGKRQEYYWYKIFVGFIPIILTYFLGQTAFVIDYGRRMFYIRNALFPFGFFKNILRFNEIVSIGVSYVNSTSSVALLKKDSTIMYLSDFTSQESEIRYNEWLAPRLAIVLQCLYFHNPEKCFLSADHDDFKAQKGTIADINQIKDKILMVANDANIVFDSCSGTIILIIGTIVVIALLAIKY